MKNGTKPTPIKHTDYDFIKSHKLGGIVPVFADEFFADAGLTMPNQMVQDTEFIPPTPPLPEGCTDFGQAELATDLTGQVHNPNELEAVTHANANGGLEIRISLDACTPPSAQKPNRLGWFKQYFNIRASGIIDYFDTFRIAQVAGIDAGEKRSITWGTPWFASWERAALAGQAIMPMPSTDELRNVNSLPWHNSKLDGWTSKNGVLVYRNKSWQGNEVGERGFIFFPREVINMVMSIRGTVAFTATRSAVPSPQTIDISTLQWILSILRNILQKYL